MGVLERRKAAKVADSQCAKDDTKNALLRIWEEHVLPNWDQVIREPRTRELWWRGVAPKSRAQVWQKAIGNDLALTEVTYSKALQRAKDVKTRLAKSGNEELGKEKAWFDAIRRDVKVTFPELNIFQPGGPLHSDLVDVLMAYSMYRSDVGYSHGTHVNHLPLLSCSTVLLTFIPAHRRPPRSHASHPHRDVPNPLQPPQPPSSSRLPNRRPLRNSKSLPADRRPPLAQVTSPVCPPLLHRPHRSRPHSP